MPLNPGNQVLTFNPPGNFVVDKYHKVPASEGLNSFVQPGGNIQSWSVKDAVSNTVYAEATHRIFTPYNANTSAVTAEWRIIPPNAPSNVSYRVLGIELVPDGWGRYFFAEFICKEENTGVST